MEVMDIILTVKAQKIKLSIAQDAKVSDLQLAVAHKIQAEVGMQKIIFKGTTISRFPGQFLSDYGLKTGSKLMIIPRETNQHEQRVLIRIKDIEQSVLKAASEVDSLMGQLDGFLKGFNESNQSDIQKHLKKGFNRYSEIFMKLVETMDGVDIDSDFQSAKLKRKEVINKIQAYLDICDASLEKIP